MAGVGAFGGSPWRGDGTAFRLGFPSFDPSEEASPEGADFFEAFLDPFFLVILSSTRIL